MIPARFAKHDYDMHCREKRKSVRDLFLSVPIGRVVRAVLRRYGLELRQLDQRKSHADDTILHGDPLSAIFSLRGGERAGFKCPIKHIRTPLGFGLSRTQWHPFLAAVMEGSLTNVKRSVLIRFFDCWQPESASDAIPGFYSMPTGLGAFPPSAAYLSPWSAKSPEAMSKWVERSERRARQEHGYLFSRACLDSQSYTEAVARFEAARLREVEKSIKSNGFDPSFGFISCTIFKRDDEFVFCVINGNHRVAVMAALGYEWVPAHIYPGPYMIDLADIDMWPQVRSGLWSKNEATNYFNHIFDFDSLAWAQENNLWTQ